MQEEDTTGNNKTQMLVLVDAKKRARQESLQAVGMIIEKQILTNHCLIARTSPVSLYYANKKSKGEKM